MIGQDTNRDCLERVSSLNGLIDSPQTIDFFNQKITWPLRKDDGEKENTAFGSNVSRHPVPYRDWLWFQDGGHASLCPPYEVFAPRNDVDRAEITAP
jgi:hypothetical protein